MSPSPPLRHPPQHLRDRVERRARGDERSGSTPPSAISRSASRTLAGRVVEARGDRQLLVVQARDVERDARVGRAAARRGCTSAALAHARSAASAVSALPGGLDHHVGARGRRGVSRRSGSAHVRALAASTTAAAPISQRLVEPPGVAARDDDARPAQAREPHEHEADGPAADHGHRLPRLDPRLARRRARRRRAAPSAPPRGSRRPAGSGSRFFATMRAGIARELGVGAVPEQQVVAQASRPVRAVGARRRTAPSSRPRRARSRRARPRRPRPTASTTPAISWPKSAGGVSIARVVAAAEHLHVGAAGERRPRAHERPRPAPARGSRHVLDRARPRGRAARPRAWSRSRQSPRSMTFSTPGPGRVASATAAGASASGKRCVISARHPHRAREHELGRQVLHVHGRAVGA